MTIKISFLVLLSLLLTPVILFSMAQTQAQVMSSTNYKIQSDSINVGGGFSSSTNYSTESTVGEIATGKSSSTNYKLRAGYQQMHEVYIAMTSASDVVMNPPIGGITGGTSNGSTSVKVTTDSLSGYQLTIKASDSPAMQKGVDSITDYVPSGANPDFTFVTNASDAHFGYSPEGTDVVQRFLDNSSTCNAGSNDTASACWDGLSTVEVPIASDTNANHPVGTETSIRFRVGIGSAANVPVGVYTATTTLTALPL